MYKTAVEYYQEPIDRSTKYSYYKGPMGNNRTDHNRTDHNRTDHNRTDHNRINRGHINRPRMDHNRVDRQPFNHNLINYTPIDYVNETEPSVIENPHTRLTWKTNEYNNMVNPNVWGPACWLSYHTGALNYPVSASPITKKRMKGFILGIPSMLPCATCSDHATIHIEEHKDELDNICSGRETLFKFFVDFHNIVNERYGKPTVSLEDAYKMYSDKVSVNILSYY
jgi:hypothetical protein